MPVVSKTGNSGIITNIVEQEDDWDGRFITVNWDNCRASYQPHYLLEFCTVSIDTPDKDGLNAGKFIPESVCKAIYNSSAENHLVYKLLRKIRKPFARNISDTAYGLLVFAVCELRRRYNLSTDLINEFLNRYKYLTRTRCESKNNKLTSISYETFVFRSSPVNHRHKMFVALESELIRNVLKLIFKENTIKG